MTKVTDEDLGNSLMAPRLVELLESSVGEKIDNATVVTALISSGHQSQQLQISLDTKPFAQSQAMSKLKHVPTSNYRRSRRNFPAWSEEKQERGSFAAPSSGFVSPLSSTYIDDAMSLSPPSPISRSSAFVGEAMSKPAFPFQGDVSVMPSTGSQALTRASVCSSRPISRRSVSMGDLFEEPRPFDGVDDAARLVEPPRLSYLSPPSLHSYGSAPEVPSSATSSRHKSLHPFTPSQIFDPNFPLFESTFDRLSLAFTASQRTTRVQYAEYRAAQSVPRGTLAPVDEDAMDEGNCLEVPEVLVEAMTPRTAFAAFYEQFKDGIKLGFHAPCVTPSGAPSPLPLCARPDGVEEILQRLRNRTRRLLWWTWEAD